MRLASPPHLQMESVLFVIHVAEIPCNGVGLCKLIKETDNEGHVNDVIESLTLNQIHHCLGHLTPAAALKLFHDGMVTSLQLESDGNADYFCESCIVGKSTWMSIMKQKHGERFTEMCKKIYSDVWEPVKVETKRGQKYYVISANDYLK